jgi:hypothetical protein
MVQLCSSVFDVVVAALDRVDGNERARTAASSFYAAVFSLVNLTYCGLIWELVQAKSNDEVAVHVRTVMRRRSLITLALFASAAAVALWLPIAGLAICIACLIVYLRPEP